MNCCRTGWISISLAALCFVPTPSLAADLEIFSGDSFEAAVDSLAPGDTLTVHEGTYADSGRISIGVKGTSSAPVVIQAAAGESRPLITRNPGASVQNTINIEGAEYLTIRGLEISGNGGDGINMSGNPSYITLEDLDIHDISVGVNFRSDMHHITVRGVHIYRTNDTGEGMYVGCNFASCIVRDSLIENNWIHNTLSADQGDGIEIKKGSHSNIVRNNVIHDTNYPCLLVYGTEGQPRNIIEGNVMWNCGDSGIQAAADAIIRNNLILDSPANGFNSQPHQDVTPGNLDFVHNTIVGGNPCVRINTWDNRPGLVFANNAVYCESADYRVGGLSGVTVAGNVFEPASGSFPGSGYDTGRSEALDFVDAGSQDYYPSSDSALLAAGDANHVAAVDFNGTSRAGSVDAGAYTWTGPQNPGWSIAEGFKGSSAGPMLTLAASPQTVMFQGQSELTWFAENVAECTASGGWAGPKGTSGAETVGPLVADSTFTLTCTDGGTNSTNDTVTVTVDSDPPIAPTLTFSAASSSVAMNGTSTLTWSTTDATSCDAGGAWNGQKTVSGSEETAPIIADSTYDLSCSGDGGSISRSVTVSVQAAPPGGSGSQDENSGGAGSFSIGIILVLGVTAARRRRIFNSRSHGPLS